MADDYNDSLKKLRNLKNRPDGMTYKEWARARKGISELQKRKDAPFNPEQHKAETQSGLAKLFIKWYFCVIIGILIYVPVYNWTMWKLFGSKTELTIGVRDIFMMVSGAITPLLAFVLGHYFKGKD